MSLKKGKNGLRRALLFAVIFILVLTNTQGLPGSDKKEFYQNPGKVTFSGGEIQLIAQSAYIRSDDDSGRKVQDASLDTPLAMNAFLSYRSAFGYGADLVYEDAGQVRQLSIDIRPVNTLISGQVRQRYIDFDFVIETNQSIYADGIKWDGKTMKTKGNLAIKGPDGETLLLFSRPYAQDYDSNILPGEIVVKKIANQTIVGIRIGAEWLAKTAAYPIKIRESLVSCDGNMICTDLVKREESELVSWISTERERTEQEMIEKERAEKRADAEIKQQDVIIPVVQKGRLPQRPVRGELKSIKKYYSQEEHANLEFRMLNSDNKSVSSEISVTLTGPHGKKEDITGRIEFSGGAYRISLPPKKGFEPGEYGILVEANTLDGVYVEEQKFLWGLVSLNTGKSAYDPSENAEFIVVTLDSMGHTVCDTAITISVTAPSGQTTILSTSDQTITKTDECGIYDASYMTGEEGIYNLTVDAVIYGANVNFTTQFLVEHDQSYEITRHAQSKIDPTMQGSFNVTVDIESNASIIGIREFLPLEFNITTDGTLSRGNDSQVITFNRTLIDNKTSVAYNYSVPDKWPYLYEIGPLEIIQDNESYVEARPWYVAVDPANASFSQSQLYISDETDTTTKYAGEQVQFYANYTNITDSTPISGSEVNCTIQFNISDTWTAMETMSYNFTSKLYAYNRSFDINGTYTWNVSCDGTSQGYEPINITDTAEIADYYPSIFFTQPTDNNTDIISRNWSYVNVSVDDSSNSTAFIDWNRSLLGWWTFNEGDVSQTSKVTYDSTGPDAGGAWGDSDTLSWEHTIAGTNTLLTVGVATSNDGANIAVTFNGNSLTSVGKVHSNNMSAGFVELFYLVNPDSGTHTVNVTMDGYGGDVEAGSVSFENVNQTNPVRNIVTDAGAGTEFATTVNSEEGNMVVDAAVYGCGGGSSIQTGRWMREINCGSAGGNGAQSTASGAPSVEMGYSITWDWWAIIAMDVVAAQGSNVSVTDRSTWGNDGTCDISNANCPIQTDSGRFGRAMDFDGTNDSIDVGDINATDNASSFTVSAWINPRSLATSKSIVSKYYGGEDSWVFGISDFGANDLYFGTGNLWASGGTNSGILQEGTWQQVVAVFDGKQPTDDTRLRIYVNGVEQVLTFVNQPLPNVTGANSRPVRIGSDSDMGSCCFFNGSIDDVQIYSRPISPEEVNASYNAGLHRLERNFTNLTDGNYTFKAYAQDASGNVNMTEERNITVDTFMPGSDSVAPMIRFVAPTDNNGAFINRNWSYVNVSVSDSLDTTAFIDWNHSLLGWWTMDSSNESGVFDSSSRGNSATFEGGLTQENLTAGRFGDAIGVNSDIQQYLLAGDIDAMDGLSQVTVSAWMKYRYADAGEGHEDHIADKSDCNGQADNGPFELFSLDGHATFAVYRMGGSPNYDMLIGGSYVDDGAWHHLVGVYDGNDLAIWVDGNLENSAYLGAITLSSNSIPFAIGGYCENNNADYYFDGSIDDVKVFNSALSPAEINASYNAGLYHLERNFTNLTDGNYTFKAYAQDASGNVNMTEERNITVDTIAPQIGFVEPTDYNSAVISRDWSLVNVSVSDDSSTTAFIDWNRSLAGWWKFNEGTGTQASDSSGNGNDGTITGSVWSNGKFGQALQCYGNGETVDIPDPANGVLDFANGNFTLSAWVNTPVLDSSSSGHSIVQKWLYNEEGIGGYALATRFGKYTLMLTGENTTMLWYGNDNSLNDLVPGMWEHVVATFDRSGNVSMYVNGVLSYSKDISPYSDIDVSNTYDLFIGSRGGGDGFNGSIDDVQVWSRVLSPDEIGSLYNATLNHLYHNFTGLPDGTYSFRAYAQDVAGNVNMTEERNITVGTQEQIMLYSCGNLTESNAVYALQNNVSSNGTCFNVLANNIMLIGNGYLVNYSVDGSFGYGINIAGFNDTTLFNLTIRGGSVSGVDNRHAVYITEAINTKVSSCDIRTDGMSQTAIYISDSESSNISHCSIQTIAGGSMGIRLDDSWYNYIEYNTIDTQSWAATGIYNRGSYNILRANRITTAYTDGISNSYYGYNEYYGNQVNTTGGVNYRFDGNGGGAFDGIIAGQDNLAWGKPLNYTANQQNIIWSDVDFTSYGEFVIAASTNITITRSNFTSSVQLPYNTNLTFSNSTIVTTHNHGLVISWSTNNVLANNMVIVSGYGCDALATTADVGMLIANNQLNATQALAAYFWLQGSLVIGNTIFSSQGWTSAVALSGANNRLVNTSITATGTSETTLTIQDSSNLTITGLNATAAGATSRGILMASGNSNVTLTDALLNVTDYPLEISASAQGIWNLTNVSTVNGSAIDVKWNSGATGTLLYSWWLDVQVNYTDGTAVSAVAVNATDRTGTLRGNSITDSQGRARLALLEYTRNNTNESDYIYYSNYTIDATESAVSDDESVNMTYNQMVQLTLEEPMCDVICYGCGNCSAELQARTGTDQVVCLNHSIWNQSLNCIDFAGADNVSFDCQGKTIDGDDSGEDYGIYIDSTNDGSSNIAVRNCVVSDYLHGLSLKFSTNSLFQNITLHSNRMGLHSYYSSGNILQNISSTENDYFDVWVDTNSLASNCDNTYGNITTSGEHPFRYYNHSVNLSNEVYSELILCDADNSNLTNITIVGSSTLDNNGMLFVMTDNSTVHKMTSSNNYYGVELITSSGNVFSDVNVSDNSESGMDLYNNCRNNVFSNVTSLGNYIGLTSHVDNHNNTLLDCTFSENRFGVYMRDFVTDNNIVNCSIENNQDYGIHVYRTCSNNTVTGSVIRNNSVYGIFLESAPPGSPKQNTFYDNILNNTVNVYSNNESNENYWNTTLTAGTNIIGGSWIAGNYWENSSSGFSVTCIDSDNNGICDSAHQATDNNTDYLPLAADSAASPIISFAPPTDNDKDILDRSWSYVNVSVIEAYPTSAFIDWNRNLVGWWTFDTTNLTHVFDNSGYGNNGTFQDGSSIVDLDEGTRGQAMSFNGVNGYIYVADAPSLRTFPDGYTVSLWIKSKSISSSPIGRWDYGYGLWHDNRWYSMNASGWVSTDAGRLTDNQWHLYAITWNLTSMTSYRDGIQYDSDPATNLQFANLSLLIGADNRGGDYLNGSIDDVMIFSRALSPEEINASYDAGQHRLEHNFTGLADGNYSFRAYAQDSAGNVNMTEERNITVDTISPQISFSAPTDNNSAVISRDWSNVNVSVNDSSYTSTFIDWNRSLVGWWRFNGEAGENGTFLKDWSTYEKNGSCDGTACPSYDAARFGQGLTFDGTDDYISIPSGSNLENNDVAISVWFKTTAVYGESEERIIMEHDVWGNTGTYQITTYQYAGEYSVYFDFYGSDQVTVCHPNFNDGNWHQFVGVFNDADGLSLGYYDGALCAQNTITTSIGSSAGTTYIGSRGGTELFFNGSIDDLMVFSRALSAEEVSASYNAGIYRLEHNFTGLADGNYSFRAYAQDEAGNVNMTEERNITIDGAVALADCTGTDPLQDSDWIITDTTVCENVTINMSVDRNVTVMPDANLTLKNVTLIMNPSADNNAIVKVNGTLNITRSNVTTTIHHYNFIAETGATLYAVGNTFTGAGGGWGLNQEGIVTSASNTTFQSNGIFDTNPFGLFVSGLTDLVLSNLTIRDGARCILTDNFVQRLVIANSSFIGHGYNLQMYGCTNCSIINTIVNTSDSPGADIACLQYTCVNSVVDSQLNGVINYYRADNNNFNVTFINTTVNGSRLVFDGISTGYYIVNYYLDIQLNYTNGTPAAGAYINILDSQNVSYRSGTADADGYFRTNLTYYTLNPGQNFTAGEADFFGPYAVRAYLGNEAGSEHAIDMSTNRQIQVNLSVDTTPPILTLDSPLGTIADVTPYLSVTSSDGGLPIDTIWFSLDGGANTTLCNGCTQTGDRLLHVAEGSHLLNIFANDTAGNTNSTSVHFTVDLLGQYHTNFSDSSDVESFSNAAWQFGSLTFYASINTGLVSRYDFTNASNLSIDSLGNNNFTYHEGTPWQSTDVPAGMSGYSVYLDGSSAICGVTTFNYTNDHTLCFWNKPVYWSGNRFAKYCTYDTWTGDLDSTYRWRINNCYGTRSDVDVPNTISLDTWIHICQVYNSSALTRSVVVNGNVSNKTTVIDLAAIVNTESPWCIGAFSNGLGASGGYHNGYIYQPVWYDRILSDAELGGISENSESNATSYSINTTRTIAGITNISWTTSPNASFIIQVSADNGGHWYNATNNAGLQVTEGKVLLYRVLLNSSSGWSDSKISSFNISWEDSEDTFAPSISFISPTDNTSATLTRQWSYVNVSVNDSSNVSAFIDWNRSLVGWWTFNEKDRNTTHVFDMSTFSNNGTITGADTASGKLGHALEFNRDSSDTVNLGQPAALQITGAMTISAWVYQTSLNTNQFIVAKSGSSGQRGWGMFCGADFATCAFVIAQDADTLVSVGGNAIGVSETGAWMHLVGVYTPSSSLKLYKNGVLVDTNSVGIPAAQYDSPVDASIGSRLNLAHFFNGSIDDVMIFNRALSPEEINASFNAGLYRLEHNFTNLADGNYSFRAYAQDSAGNVNMTEDRHITVDTEDNNTSPTIDALNSIDSVAPVAGGVRSIEINFTASDPDGSTDMNDNTSRVTVSKQGVSRSGNCSASSINSTTNKYNCSIHMLYYDAPGIWSINVSIADLLNQTASNDTTSFSYNQLLYLQATPSIFRFGNRNPGEQLAASSNPLILDNLGNVNLTQINITAFDLANGSYIIGAGNATVNISDAPGMMLENGSELTISSARVNLDANGVDENESLYFYISIPNVAPLDYKSTQNWVISAIE
jgi:hypothetical protein